MYLYGKRCDEPLGSCCPVPDMERDVDIRRMAQIARCRSCGSEWEASESDLCSPQVLVPWKRVQEGYPSMARRPGFHMPTTAQLRQSLVEAAKAATGPTWFHKEDEADGMKEATERTMRSEIIAVAATLNELKKEFGLHEHTASAPPVRAAPNEAWMGMNRPTGFKGDDSLTFIIDGAPTETVTFDAADGMNRLIATGPAIKSRIITDHEQWVDAFGPKQSKPKRPPSRHQARLEKHAARRPLPGDKRAEPEGKGRRWFWPAVLALMTLLSGAAAVLTIADKWPSGF